VNVKIDGTISLFYDKETKALQDKAQQEEVPIDGKWNLTYKLPDLKVLYTFSDRVYSNSKIKNIKEIEHTRPWKILCRVQGTVLLKMFDGFYAELHYNTENNYLLLAIKGSSNAGNYWSDLKNVTLGSKGGEIDSAFTFGEEVRKLISKFKCKPMLIITGHSLGGYLAQIITYTIIYCFVDEDGIVCSREEPSDDFGIYTVVFDSPPAYTQISSIDPRNPVQFARFRLPITNVIYKVNAVNNTPLLGQHLGQVLAVKEFDSSGAVGLLDMMNNTKEGHSLQNFANIQENQMLKVYYLETQEAKKYNCKAVPLQFYSIEFAKSLEVYSQLPAICKALIGKLPNFRQTTSEILIEDDASIEEFIPQAIHVLERSKDFLKKQNHQGKICKGDMPVEELLYSDQDILRERPADTFDSATEFAYELMKGMLRFVVISSEAGMGKSTALKKIARTLQQELPNYLIVHLNLFRCQSELSEIGETLSSEQAMELVKNLALADFREDDWLRTVFNWKRETREMLLLFDSLDEICPLYRDAADILIERLRETDIQIVVTTRPNEVQNLKGAETFTLEPLDCFDKKLEFLRKRFSLVKIPVPSDLFKWLVDISDGIDGDFWSAPLSLVMAVYILGMDTEIRTETRLRRQNIYREFLKKSIEDTLGIKMEIDKHKASVIADFKKKIKKYRVLVTMLAICTVFNLGDVREEYKDTIADKKEFINRFDVAKVDNECKNVTFIHKSFAEYLTAEAFVQNIALKAQKPKLTKDELKVICLNPEFTAIRGHICGFLADSTIEKTLLPEIIKGDEKHLLELLVKEDCYQLYTLLKNSLCFAHDKFVMEKSNGEVINLLYLALERAREDFVKEMLKEGADFDKIVDMPHVLRYAVEKNLYKQLQFHILPLQLSIERGEHFKSFEHICLMKSGSREMAELIIKNGFGVNKDVIYYATMLNNSGVMDLVLEKSPPDLKTGIIFAAKFNRIQVFSRIYVEIQDNLKFVYLQMALSTAAANGHLEFCEYLCALGAISKKLDSRGESSLHHAAAKGHLQCVKFLAKDLESVDVMNVKGETPLMKALFKKRGDIVEWLLDNKADIHLEDQHGHNCLHFAAHGGDKQCVKLLLDEGLNIDHQARNGCTPLHYASETENAAIVKYLLVKSANPNITDEDGNTCLHLASRINRRLQVMKILVEHIQINSLNIKQETPLQMALLLERKDIVTFLLDKGANPDIKNQDGETSLLVAIKKRYKDIVKLLLGKKADVNAEDSNGRSGLHITAGEGNNYYAIEVLEMLLAAGAEINHQDKDGQPALLYGLSRNTSKYDKTYGLLIRKGADPNIKDKTGQSCLHVAAGKGLINVMEQLVDKKADVNAINNAGKSCLQFAAEGGVLKCVEFFVKRGAKIDHRDKKGWTALFYASKQGEADIIQCLLQNSASAFLTDNEGNTCLHYVRSRKYHGLEGLKILAENTPVDCKNHRLETPLHWAVADDRDDIVSLLLGTGADPHLKNIDGQTSLHLAAKGGHFITLKILIEWRTEAHDAAEIDAKDNMGLTVLLHAVQSGRSDIIEYLLEKSANPDVTDNYGNTCLHYASRISLRCVTILENHYHYPVDCQNQRQETPLHWAALSGHCSIVSFFLERGADPDLKNSDGQSSLHLAAKKGHVNTVNVLVGKSADLYAEDKNGHMPAALAEQPTIRKSAATSQNLLIPQQLSKDREFKLMQALLPRCDFESPFPQQEKLTGAEIVQKLY
jgi:ankyrin repeat protein